MGGPLGTGAVRLAKRSSQSVIEGQYKDAPGSMQIPLGDDHVEYAEMGSLIDQERQRELQREDLFERCSFIKSLAKKLDH